MIHFIKGTLAEKGAGRVVIENGGIGYEIGVPENSAVYLSGEGDQVKVFTAMIVKEDDVSLYGFSDRESLALFHKLMTVNGVGAKAAMSILSAMPLSELSKAIIFGDATMLTRANGIGKKSAQRIILELKDKLDFLGEISGMPEETIQAAAANSSAGSVKNEAVEALMGLGYSKAEASSAVMSVKDGEELSVEAYIKKALKQI